MKKILTLFIVCLYISIETKSQICISNDNSAPASSSGLEVKFSNKGFLPPRMTYTQREAIMNPAEGLLIFCTNCVPGNKGALSVYTHGNWIILNKCETPMPSPLGPVMHPNQITWKWTGYATGYKWNTNNDFDNAIDVGSNMSKTETGIVCGLTYTRYLWAYYNCGASEPVVLTVTVPEEVSPDSPQEANHTSYPLQIVWKWHRVPNARGYKWNSINNENTAIDVGPDSLKTQFGLSCLTSYTSYVWAYNACGVSNPTTMTQTTLSCQDCLPFTDNRDGKTYNVVQIADQCWMAQNLNIGDKIFGSVAQTNNSLVEKYCYNDLDSLCNIYGGLYQWGETVGYYNGASNSTTWYFPPVGNLQGICPDGWHLPDYYEWIALRNFVGSYQNAGGLLKESGTLHWALPNTGATNATGFSGLPGGCRNGSYNYLGYTGYFWSLTECGCYQESWSAILRYDDASFFEYYTLKTTALPVRCLKNQ